MSPRRRQPSDSPAFVAPERDRADALAAHIAARIRDEALPLGTRLPSVRSSAALYGVSPGTVVAAYDKLQARGLVEARRQSGYFVRGAGAAFEPRPTAPVELAAPVDATALIRGMFRGGDRALGPGAGTLPPDWLDHALLQRALRHAMRDSAAALRYGESAGDAGFRAAIVTHLREVGIVARSENIVSTVGATHALDLVARTLLRPGDAVLVDEPGWAVEFARLARMGMRLLAVPRGDDGPDLAVFERLALQHRPRLYVTVSVLHNPTGASLSPAAAHRVCRLADEHDITIVEDDTYAWLAPPGLGRLTALDGLSRTVYVSGFAKILAPDWRVGFLAAPTAIAERCIDTKLLATLSVPTLFERAVTWLLEQGLLRRHAARVLERLDGARNRVVRLAREAGCTFASPPRGLFGWLDVGVDTERLAEVMAADGWLLAPGHLFMVSRAPSTLMRVNFATSADARFWRALEAARARLARSS